MSTPTPVVRAVTYERDGERCAVEGCGRQVRARGYCVNHWRANHLYGDPLGTARGSRPDRCTAEGCERSDIQGRGLCRKHYHRLYRKGTLEARTQRPKRGICRIDDCATVDIGPAGYCAKHATRVVRHGDPSAVLAPRPLFGAENPRWTGEAASYETLHQRVRHARGSAKKLSCVDCGGIAAHWSYNNSGVQERVSPKGRYSLDIDQYEPRCVPCHSRFDADARSAS